MTIWRFKITKIQNTQKSSICEKWARRNNTIFDKWFTGGWNSLPTKSCLTAKNSRGRIGRPCWLDVHRKINRAPESSRTPSSRRLLFEGITIKKFRKIYKYWRDWTSRHRLTSRSRLNHKNVQLWWKQCLDVVPKSPPNLFFPFIMIFWYRFNPWSTS